MTGEYINLNGEYFSSDQPVLTINNRAFKYSDGLFETLFASGGKIPLFDLHIERLIKSMNIMKMEIPVKFNDDANKIYNEIIRLAVKNRCFLGSRIRLSVFRNDGGLYTPETNEVSYTIETNPLKNSKFELNQIGLKIGIFEQYKKPVCKLSNIKSSNSQLYILASDYRKTNFYDEILLLNENNYLVEAISSNLFICKDNIIYTPSLSEGCISGVMRKKIIEIARNKKFEIISDCMLTEENLLQADEVFLTNAVSGIKWVGAFKNRRYFNKISKTLINHLNEELFVV